MTRLSRDKWLLPEEVRRIGMALSRCASYAPHTVFNHAFSDTCSYVGMINGEPPARPFDPHYGAVIKIADEAKPSRRTEAMIALLKTQMLRQEIQK
jgi:hypothetical protein